MMRLTVLLLAVMLAAPVALGIDTEGPLPDPEMQEHQTFNRIMYLVMQPICFRAVPRGITEFFEEQRSAARTQGGSSLA